MIRKKSLHSGKGLLLPVFATLSWITVIASASTESAGLTEELYFGDLPVVLSATRLEQPMQDSPASISIIDQKMIRASGATEIVDLLRLVPGFSVGYYTGSKFSASYHGMADQYARDMQVLIDGRSVYDPVFGGVSWSDLPLHISDIQRMEVIRGPNAATFGSNSFAGVINIITIHPSRLPAASINAVVGEGNTRNLTLRHAGSSGKMDYSLSVNYDENSGFDSRYSDDSDTRWLNLRGNYDLNANQRIDFSAGFSDASRQGGFLGDEVQPPRTAENTYNYQQVKWTHLSSPGNEYSLQFYRNYQQVDDHFILEVPVPPELSPVQLGHGFDSERYDIEFQSRTQHKEKWRVAWGLGLRQDKGKSIWTLHTDDYITRNQARAFFNAEKSLDDFTLNFGGMYEKYEGQQGLLSPRLGINYHLDNEHTFRASASRAYRMPTIYEANANVMIFAGDPPFDLLRYAYTSDDLQPEKIDAIELGYIGKIPQLGLTLDAKLFKEKISNVISLIHNATIPDPIPVPEIKVGADEYINSGHAEIHGLEIALGWKPSPRMFLHAGLSLTELDGEQTRKIDENGTVYYRPFDKQTPARMLSLLGSYRFGSNIQLSSAYYYMDEIYWRGDGDAIPASHRWDIKLAKNFHQSDVSGELSLMIQNIGGDYHDFYIDTFADAPDRNNIWTERVFLQLALNWL